MRYSLPMKSAMDLRKEYEREQFLKLSPLERVRTMHAILCEILALRARAEGVTEYEIYRRYIRDNPRHYQKRSTAELAKRIGRDKKFNILLAPPPEELPEELSEELI